MATQIPSVAHPDTSTSAWSRPRNFTPRSYYRPGRHMEQRDHSDDTILTNVQSGRIKPQDERHLVSIRPTDVLAPDFSESVRGLTQGIDLEVRG